MLAPTNLPPWWPDWTNECVAIVGSGPSAKEANVDALRDRIHVIVINESWRLAPWADILYGCDAVWWSLNKGVKEFPGLKISQDENAVAKFPEIKRVIIEDPKSNVLSFVPGTVGAGGNSGFQAFNLAVQFRATGILLIGLDLRLDRGDHWHGRHPQPLCNPDSFNIRRWVSVFERTTGITKNLGIDVVNASPNSALTTFPKLTVEQTLERWGL